MNELKMSHAPVGMLRPNPWNTNSINSPENEQRMRESLRRYGMFKPVIVREVGDHLQIIGGEHRWRFAKEEGHETVPIVNLGAISDTKAKEIGLVDNGRYGEDDALALSELLQELGETIKEVMPFSDDDLAALMAASSIGLDDLDMPIKPGEEPVSLDDLKKPEPITQVMRFKVPIEDVTWLTSMIEREMKEGGFTNEDALANAGNAFVSLMKKAKGAPK